MMELTDPARELAELCERLSAPNQSRGDQHLASQFQVPPWSGDFYRIVFCIIERADYVSRIIDTLSLDDDIKEDAKKSITEIKSAFDQRSLTHPWNTSGMGHSLLAAQNSRVIKVLSGHVREKASYPKLSDEEVEALLADINELEIWLNEHQLADQDFIRQAILDGLVQFKFRLQRLKWLGWGYTVESLRDVVGAYMALERGAKGVQASPDAEAALKKVGKTLQKVYAAMKVSKEAHEMTDWVLNAYLATTFIGKTVVAGLLTYSG